MLLFSGTNVEFKYRSIFREVGKVFGLPKEELDMLATKPIQEHDNKRVPITQNQFDALISHTYNTGGSDGLFKFINDRAACATIRNWIVTKYITAQGVKLNGLIRRRKAEADLFFAK